MPYLLIPVLQIACVIHAFRTGRDRMWIYILLFLPGIGVVAYALVEMLPEVFGSRAARGLKAQAVSRLDPGRDIRRWREALEEADTVENRRLLAEALVAAGEYAEAVGLYHGILIGIHADDPGCCSAWRGRLTGWANTNSRAARCCVWERSIRITNRSRPSCSTP
jgi:hypothetical protein